MATILGKRKRSKIEPVQPCEKKKSLEQKYKLL